MLGMIAFRKSLGLYTSLLLALWILFVAECSAKTIVYAANTDSQTISVFELSESSGQLTPVQELGVSGAVMPMAIKKNENGNSMLFAAVRSPPFMLVAMDIDPSSGRLTIKTSVPLVDNMANIALDRSGNSLFAASYSGNKISVQSFDDNLPSPAADVIATGKHPHQITTSPDNQFVYVSLLGDDRVDYFRLGEHARKLQMTEKNSITLPSGSGPRHFVFSADGNFVYLIAELSAQVHVLARDAKTGTLSLMETHSLLPKHSTIKPWAADIHLTPDGNYLYASERSDSRLYAYRVNARTGKLARISSWKTEQQPRAFAVSPDGRYVVAAGQVSNRLSVYAINPATGKLQRLHSTATGANPSWVEIIQLKKD